MTDKKTPKEMFDYRINLIRDTFDHKKTERVPIMSNAQQWIYLDAGYSILEAARDYDKCLNAGRKFLTNYKVDLLSGGGGLVRNPTQLYDALGQSSTWAIAGGDENNLNAIFEDEMMKEDEYDEFIKDYEKTVWEKCYFRTFKNSKDFNLEQWVNAAKAAKDLLDAKIGLTQKMRDEFGITDQISVPAASMFAGNLVNTYRGIKGLAKDMRRQPDKVAELCAVRDEITANNAINAMSKIDGHNMNEPYDVTMGFLAHCIMSAKQFERYYVPGLRKVASYCEEHGKQMFMNTEADFLRFGDFFNEYKKGVVNCIVEMDDPFEIRKQLPNVGIIGGLSVDLMGNATPEKCIDMAKKAIDVIGRDGGLMLSPNKFITYAYDMKSENLKAVCDFVVDYRG